MSTCMLLLLLLLLLTVCTGRLSYLDDMEFRVTSCCSLKCFISFLTYIHSGGLIICVRGWVDRVKRIDRCVRGWVGGLIR